MGHANVGITLDHYGHLLPGADDEAAGMLDAFLAHQVGGAPEAFSLARWPKFDSQRARRPPPPRGLRRGARKGVPHRGRRGLDLLGGR